MVVKEIIIIQECEETLETLDMSIVLLVMLNLP